ncbi:MAG: hypothetical protein RL685_3751 [Pseudomonadota bacterium]|jgi:hypothetical protein
MVSRVAPIAFLRLPRFAALALSLLAGCAGAAGQFPLREPLWQDPDQQPFGPRPEEYVSPMVWDVGDQSVFYPFTRIFAVDPAGESLNVNALDEVPDSSWFTNRIGQQAMSAAEVALGPCAVGAGHVPTPWTVVGAKPNGANPGFMIEDAGGKRHLVKFDGLVQGPRATAADVIVSKLYHAVGYTVPCNRIVSIERGDVKIGEGATSETSGGQEEPLTQAHVEEVFSKAQVLPDGRMRASTSEFLEGRPIGPFTYQGRRSDDPNDIISHQDRRELRGMRLLAAWTQHFDAREQNTLAMWIETGPGQGYVRHDVIDFGDCFGSIWEPPGLGRRLGHSHYVDLQETLDDWFTLGLRERPWDRARFGPSGKVFGYYDVADFDPEAWKAGYPNPAFGRMSERDGAWMARILSTFTDDVLRRLVREGNLSEPLLESELLRILSGRRDRILERYLGNLSPLTHPELRRGAESELCLRDLVSASGLQPEGARRYAVTAYLSHGVGSEPAGSEAGGGRGVPLSEVKQVMGQRVCTRVPRQPGASPQAPGYLIVDWVSQTEQHSAELPARVHLYDLGADGLRIVGLERPDSFEPPR